MEKAHLIIMRSVRKTAVCNDNNQENMQPLVVNTISEIGFSWGIESEPACKKCICRSQILVKL